jgi:hypothetical protein
VLTDTVHAPLMAEAVELAMHTIATAIDALPKSADPEISQKAGPILADLRKLEVLAANAAATRRALLRAAVAVGYVGPAALRGAAPGRTERRRGGQCRRRPDRRPSARGV